MALNLYWFVKVEIKDTKILSNSSSNAAISQQQQQQAQIAQQSAASSGGGSTSNLLATAGQSGAGGDSYANQQGSNAAAASSTANASNANDQSSKTNFQIFMDELIDSLRNVSDDIFMILLIIHLLFQKLNPTCQNHIFVER